jgi:endonuclease/exonuclease/phosphatase family metal-dependent hydrolase
MRIVTWNMNHGFRRHQAAEQWAFLDSLEPTIALVQEAPERDGNFIRREVEGRGLGTGVLGYGEVKLTEVPCVRLGEPLPARHLEASHPGSFVVAECDLGLGRKLQAISIYGLMKSAFTKVVYATAPLHRLLSDLTPILDAHRNKKPVVMGGDLNITPQFPAPDGRAHQVIIDRIEAFGMTNCLGACNAGAFVRTLRHQNKIDSAPYQNDWLFASTTLKPISCKALDTKEAWALSDHCPVVADFDFGRVWTAHGSRGLDVRCIAAG